MPKFVFFVIVIVLPLLSTASPTAQLFLNPYYPEFSESSDELTRNLMDANLENEIQQYIQRRDHLETLMIEQTQDYAGMLQKNTFAMRRMMDRVSRRALKSPLLKKTTMGRLADDLKEKLQTEVEFRDIKNIEHKFDFKIAAFQGQAFIQYSGFTKAQLRYDIDNGGSVAMIFQHDLSPTSSIGIESTLVGDFRTQSVLLNLIW